ncbi:hypothetical protein V1477_001480 [Vespula maculifrons]|uniref:Uncharacterized protein n=1 Tax=Vespula maculifrons TaxID=7453 RepID=A0ABD2CYU3_VESMC
MPPTIEPRLADQLGHPTRLFSGETSLRDNTQRYTRLNEGESSFNSLEILQSCRIDCYLNCNFFQRKYVNFNYAA